LVNKSKSAVFFSENCGQEVKEDVHESLQIPTEALGDKYLGLPTAVGCATEGTFNYVADRIRNFTQGWGGQLLSCAGREVLIKANGQAVPTYPMSCFKIPAPTCKKMKNIISNYWWGSTVDNHKLHWQRWSKLTRPKGEGGMGFRDLSLFNQAMLGKQGWCLITRSESLCTRVLKGKYFPNCTFLEATRKKKSSATWRAILFGRQAMVKGLIKRIGPGDSTNIWSDNWISTSSLMRPLIRLPGVQAERVCDLFVPGTRQWDVQLVIDSFCAMDAGEILKLKLGLRMEEDVTAWAFERSGLYSVRSCYRMLKREKDQLEAFKLNEAESSLNSWWWPKLWKLKIPPKVRIFWWRVLNNFLPSKAELKRRHVAQEDHCESCGEAGESVFHIAISCPLAVQFWREVKNLTGCKVPHLHRESWATDLLSGKLCSMEEAELFICGAWSLWSGRNACPETREGVLETV
jgi:hypothetical protein